MSIIRLRKIAEQLRSNALNEREMARITIEKSTGKTIQTLVRDGTVRLPADHRIRILDNLDLFEDDDLVQFVTDVISDLNHITWPIIIETAETRKSDSAWVQDNWDAIFGGNGFWNLNTKTAPTAAPKKPRPRCVSADELPAFASGTPHIQSSGTARNGQPFVIVSFHRLKDFGNEIIPNCSFAAFGKKWVEELTSAENENSPIYFSIKPSNRQGLNPIIGKAA